MSTCLNYFIFTVLSLLFSNVIFAGQLSVNLQYQAVISGNVSERNVVIMQQVPLNQSKVITLEQDGLQINLNVIEKIGNG